jgi:hypothetical protein
MDELRESSLLFSLEGLLETERERVQREAREAQKRRDEEMVRVAEQASRLRLAAQQEREARERRVVLEQERERLAAERIDAMKHASVERARIEAEGQLRLVELEQVRKHDLALAALREQQKVARYRTFTWLSATAFALSVSGALFGYFGWLRPAQARELSHLQSVMRVDAEQAKAGQRALASERSLNQALTARLEQLHDQLAAASNVRPEPKVHPVPARPPAVARPPLHKRCADNGDPIDGCIH